MSNEEPAQIRPFVFTIIEDDGVNVTIEISEEDYLADLAAGCDEDETMKPSRYLFKRGGFLERHPELKSKVTRALFNIIAQGRARSATPWESDATQTFRATLRGSRAEWFIDCFPGRCPGLLYFTPLA